LAASGREGGAGAIGAINRAFGALAGWCFDQRWIVLAATAALTAGALWLYGTARIDNSYEAFFAVGDPTYRNYLTYRDDFGSDEVSYLMYEAPGKADGVFDLETMGKIARASCIASRVCGKSRHSLRISIPSVVGCTSSALARLFTS